MRDVEPSEFSTESSKAFGFQNIRIYSNTVNPYRIILARNIHTKTSILSMTSWNLNWHRSGSQSFKISPGVTGNMMDIAYCFASILTSNLSGVASPRWPRSITENHISGCTSRDTVFVTSLMTEALRLTPHFPRYLPVAGETLHGQEINVPMALQNRDRAHQSARFD